MKIRGLAKSPGDRVEKGVKEASPAPLFDLLDAKEQLIPAFYLIAHLLTQVDLNINVDD